MEIKAVVFDVDGTLYPNIAMYRRSAFFALKNIRFIHHFSKVRKKIRHIPQVTDFRSLQAELLAESMRMTKERAGAIISQHVHKWENLLKGIPLVHGLHHFLGRLDDNGIPRGLLSDFPLERKMAILGLPDGWNCEISSEDVGYLKPSEKPFQAVCEHMQIAPEHVLYVGNSYSYDVIGAKRAGMWVAHLARTPQHDSIADVTFSEYHELEEWLFNGAAGSQP